MEYALFHTLTTCLLVLAATTGVVVWCFKQIG